jgi:urea carboxylase
LREGDQLAVGPRVGRAPRRVSLRPPFPLPEGGSRIRAIAALDDDDPGPRCGDAALAGFTTTRFTLAAESNRMGYRLCGTPVALADETPVLSAATPFGTVQVPPSGHPILLMADRQTTGGYAKIATVISADLPVAGQLGPGDWIRFELCDRRSAVAALIAQQQTLMRVTRCPAKL